MTSEKQVLDALCKITDPDFNRDIVSLGFIKELSIDNGKDRFAVELTTPASPLAEQFEQEARRVVASQPDVTEVSVRMTARPRKARELVDGSGLSETAVMRGPMVANFIQQMLHHVAWAPLDYLVINIYPREQGTPG